MCDFHDFPLADSWLTFHVLTENVKKTVDKCCIIL